MELERLKDVHLVFFYEAVTVIVIDFKFHGNLTIKS